MLADGDNATNEFNKEFNKKMQKLGLGLAMGLCLIVISSCLVINRSVAHTEAIRSERFTYHNYLVQRVYDVAAGDDKHLDEKEQQNLIKELGVTPITQSGETLTICVNDGFLCPIRAYVGTGEQGSGKFRSYIGRVRASLDPKVLEEYLMSHGEKISR